MELYPWLEPMWQRWQLMLTRHAIPNAMLCNAKVGTGMEQLVSRLAAAIVCKNADDEACGFCHSCELSQSGHHPDVHWVQPEKDGKAISVDQIRDANRYAIESSQLGGKRVIIIHPAEAMNESASNALLKTLETPPERCVFILLSEDKHKLLPTITSRCQHWQLPIIKKTVLLEWLTQKSSKAAASDWFCIKMYAQSPLQALEFIEQDKHLQWQNLLELLNEGLTQPAASLTPVQTFFKEDPLEKLTWLLYLFNDLQKAHFGVYEGPFPSQFESLIHEVSYEKAHHHYQQVQKLYRSLHTASGLNAELLILDWYLGFIQP